MKQHIDIVVSTCFVPCVSLSAVYVIDALQVDLDHLRPECRSSDRVQRRRMLTAEAKLPTVQPSSSPYSCTPDAHVPVPPQTPHTSLGPSCASSLQHSLHSSQQCSSSFASIHSLTADRAVSPRSPQRAGVECAPSFCDCDSQETQPRCVKDADLNIQSRIRASYSDVQRHTIDGSLPLPELREGRSPQGNMYRQPSAASAILPTRQQQLAAICRLRKPLAVVTQKNSLIRRVSLGTMLHVTMTPNPVFSD